MNDSDLSMTNQVEHGSILYARRNQERFLKDLNDCISIPSISANKERAPDIMRCVEWLSNHLKEIGMMKVKVFATRGNPLVYAEWQKSETVPTVLYYGHYDVQPEDPIDDWEVPPFKATVRGRRVYGRGTADDKGQIFVNIKALESCLRTEGGLPVNVKIILEGEEEIGGENLNRFLEEHQKLLSCDIVMISDTPFYAEDCPSLCCGLRGIAYMQIDLVGPNRDLHSGSFGGIVHNPIQALSEIIASLHDEKGRILVDGFYEDVRPLTSEERNEFRKFTWDDRVVAEDLGLAQLYGEEGFSSIERLWARPTLECNGVWGGYTSEGVKTVIPSSASAKISMRLVPNQDPARIARLFENHIAKIVPRSVRASVRCLSLGHPALTPVESVAIKAAMTAIRKAFGKTPLLQREGGSIPIVSEFKRHLGVDTLLMGFGLPNENAHAPNEFLSLDNFFKGIEAVIHFYHELSRVGQNSKNDIGPFSGQE